MLKKLFLLLLLAGVWLPQRAHALVAFTYEGVKYYYESGAVWTYHGSTMNKPGNSIDGALNLPDSVPYEGVMYPLTKIGSFGFTNNKLLTSVRFPATLITIESYAFDGCYNVTTLEYPTPWNIQSIQSMPSVGSKYDFVFSNPKLVVTGLSTAKRVLVPSTCSYSSSNAMKWDVDKGLVEVDGCFYSDDMTILYFVPATQEGVFEVPYGVTTIGPRAFYKCTEITGVTIPSTVTSIGDYAFSACDKLQFIDFSNARTSLGERALSVCPALTDVRNFSNLTSIGDFAFYNSDNIVWPEYIKFNCITSIGSYQFLRGKVKGFDFPKTLTTIGNGYYFYYSSGNSYPTSTTPSHVAYHYFKFSVAATESSLIKSVEYYDGYGHILAGKAYKEIWPEVFDNGTTISYRPGYIPHYIYPAGSVVTRDAVYNSDMTELLSVANVDGTFTIPASVKTIRPGAFDRCRLLTGLYVEDSDEALVFPANMFPEAPITSLYMGRSWQYDGEGAMLSGLQEVVLGPSVKSIPVDAFLGCSALTSISLPASVSSIGAKAFGGCPDIETVDIYSLSTPYITENTFEASVYENAAFTYPSAAAGAYMSRYNNWYRFAHAETSFNQELPAETFEADGFAYKYLSDDEITIVYADSYQSLTEVVIPSVITIELEPVVNPDDPEGDPYIPTKDLTVVAIADKAFAACENITSVTIPATVRSIGTIAFEGCTALASVNLGENLEKIGEAAFRNCSSLASVAIPAGVTEIPATAFESCTALASVDFLGDVTSIGASAFANTGLTSVDLPAVSVIGRTAFNDCTALKNATIGSTLTAIHPFAFENVALTAITLTGKNAAIGEDAFCNNTALKTVALGDGIASVGARAFSGNSKLTTVSIGKDIECVGDSAFVGTAISTLNFVKDGALKEIGVQAFLNLRIRSGILDLPDNLEKIGDGAFFYARRYDKIVLPANERLVIGKEAFASAQGITSLEFPVKVNTIGEGAFKDASNLVSVDIKADTIKAEAFANSKLLASATVTGEGSLGSLAFNACPVLTDVMLDIPVLESKALYVKTASVASTLASVVMTDKVTQVADSAFMDNAALVDVKFGKGLEYVGQYAFANCNLDSLVFPSAEQPDPKIIVDSYAFTGVNKLKHVSLGNRTAELKKNASITITPSSNATETIDLGSTITAIPDGSIGVNKYQYGYQTIYLKKLVIPPSVQSVGTCWFYVDTIMFPYAEETVTLKSTYISAKTMSIDRKYSFSLSTSSVVSNLIFGDTKEAEINVSNVWRNGASTVHIGAAVKSISSLTVKSITFDEGVESISSLSLGYTHTEPYASTYSPYSGKAIRFPASLKSLGKVTYVYGTKPSEIIFTDGEEPIMIDNAAFADLQDNLKSFYLGRNIEGLGGAEPPTLEGAPLLETLVVGDGVTRVNDNMFKGCTALKHALMSDYVTEIGENAFNGCTGLDVLSISANVKTIGDNAYADCDHFNRIVARGTVPAEGYAGFGQVVEKNVPLYVPAQAYDDYCDSDLFWAFEKIETFGGNVIKDVETDAEIVDAEAGTTHNIPDMFNVTLSIIDEEDFRPIERQAPRAAKAARRAPENAPYTSELHWFAPTPEIASVDANGVVTVNKTEPAEIWVYALDGSDKKAVIRVNNPAIILGDINGDKIVDSTDLNMLIEHVVSPDDTTVKLNVADMNSDGVLDSTDINMLIEKIINENE